MVARAATGHLIPSDSRREAVFTGHPARLSRLEIGLIFVVLILSMNPGFDWLTRKLAMGQTMVFGIWALLYALTITHLTMRLGVRWVAWAASKFWVVWVTVGLCILSSIWSPDSALVLRRSISLAGTCVVGMYAAMLLPPERLLRYLFIVIAAITFIGAFLAVFAPGYGTMAWGSDTSDISDAWRGVVGHKQTFGAYVAYLAMICLAKMTGRHSRHWVWIGLFGLFAVFVIMAQSATALLTVVGSAGLVVLMVLLRQMEIPSIIARFSIFYAFALVAIFALINVGTFMESIGKAETFDNRTRLWSNAMSMIIDSPFLGLGYEVAWFRQYYPEFQPTSSHPHAHNGFLNLASQIGVPITILVFSFVCVVFARSVRLYFQRPTVFNRFAMLYLGAFFVMNITRSLLFKYQESEWVFYLTITTAVLIQDQMLRRTMMLPEPDEPEEVPGVAAERS